MTTKVDGKVVKVGDVVGFKCDIEQYGTILQINGNTLTLGSNSGFIGDYIGGSTTHSETSDRCWLD